MNPMIHPVLSSIASLYTGKAMPRTPWWTISWKICTKHPASPQTPQCSSKGRKSQLGLNPRYLSTAPKLSQTSHNSMKHSETGLEHQQNITKLSGQHHCRTTSPIWVDGCLKSCHRERNPILSSEYHSPETFRTQTPQKCSPPYGLMGIKRNAKIPRRWIWPPIIISRLPWKFSFEEHFMLQDAWKEHLQSYVEMHNILLGKWQDLRPRCKKWHLSH